MKDDERTMRVAVEARSASVHLTPQQAAVCTFVRENADGTTVWEVDGQGVTLFPGDLMRYNLTDRMRQALSDGLSEPPGGTSETTEAQDRHQGIPEPEQALPRAFLQLVEGRTEDGWRWHVVREGKDDRIEVAIDNKPQTDEAKANGNPYPELCTIVLPLDVICAIATHAEWV